MTPVPAGCLGDCPFLLQACPTAEKNASQCTGNGRCLSATGTCVCFLGYAGSDCSLCAEGYLKYGFMHQVLADLLQWGNDP